MRKYLSFFFLLVFALSILAIRPNVTPINVGSPKNHFVVKATDNNSPTPKVRTNVLPSTLTQLSSVGLSYPLEGELSTYQSTQALQVLQQNGAVITATEFDILGNFYVLGNYNTSLMNFTLTGLNTLGSPISFSSGTPSSQSSFILAYNYNNAFIFGKELDFDDNFDYYMVSMKATGSVIQILSEKRPTTYQSLSDNVDITVFSFSPDLSSYKSATYGGLSRETLGLPMDFNYGIKNIPVNLLQVDSSGNTYIAGVTNSVDFSNSNTDYRKTNFQKSFNFAQTNLSDPYYSNISFSGSVYFGNWQVQNNQLTSNDSTNLIQTSSAVDYVQINTSLNNYAKNIVADWNFHEVGGTTTTDIGPNNIVGTINNAQWALSKTSYGLSFDGAQDNVTVNSPPSTLSFGAGGFTVSTWFKTTGGSSTTIILSKGLSELVSGNEYSISIQSNGVILAGIGNGTSAEYVTGTKIVTDNIWHNVILNVDPVGGYISQYIDGVLDGSVSRTIAWTGTNQPLVFGELAGYPAFNDYSFNGTMDDIVIVNRNLSVNEIQDMYKNIYDQIEVAFYSDLNQAPLWWEQIGPDNQNTLIPSVEFSTPSPSIKYIFISNLNGTTDFGQFGITSISLKKHQINNVTNYFESFNGAVNEAIGTKIPGFNMTGWYAWSNVGGNVLGTHSGTQGIIPFDSTNLITFYNPVSYVSFYVSESTESKIVYFQDESNNTISNFYMPVGNNSLIEFGSIGAHIKSILIRSQTNDYTGISLDDFSYADQQSLFVLKLNPVLTFIGSAVLPIDTGTKLAVTSLVLDSANNLLVGGISNGYFTTNGTATPYQNLNFQSSGTGFIASFNSTLAFESLTTLGGVNHSAIYSMAYNNSKLFIGGQSLSDSLLLNPNIQLSAVQPSNGSGFIAEVSPSDWNLLYYRSVGDPNVPADGSAVTSVAVQSNYVYYEGLFNKTSTQSVFQNIGPISNGTTVVAPINLVPFLGILNSSLNNVYLNALPNDLNDLAPMSVNSKTGELYRVFSNGTIFSVFGIQDVDGDGLSNWNEIHVYHTNPNVADSDGDTLSDAAEIYAYHTNPLNQDTDGDCLTDGWEVANGYDPNFYNANVDNDHDGLTAFEEIQAGTSDNSNDTDGDGISDYNEVMIYHTKGNMSDSDMDGLTDFQEIFVTHTSPLNNDTDGDKLTDFQENNMTYTLCDTTNTTCYTGKTDPLNPDTDGDGLSDYTELMSNGSVPWLKDSDGDGINDYQEYLHQSNAWAVDTDQDGLNDTAEILVYHTNVTNPDSDYDGLNDSAEILHATNPWLNDTDQDNLTDGFEVNTFHSNPLLKDSDNDTLSDFVEYKYGSNPISVDSDNDSLPDAWEYKYNFSSSFNNTYLDPDNDNLTNIQEFNLHTNPLSNDTDHDNLPDYNETVLGTNPLVNDTDLDGLNDGAEVNIYRTDPLSADTDADNLTDGAEVLVLHSNPLSGDTDNDSIGDYQEYKLYNTSLTSNDTDKDNLSDYYEIFISGTNPLNNDTDFDGLSDSYELNTSHTNPLAQDTDSDGLNDKLETTLGTNPISPDSDSDGLSDGKEYFTFHTNPLVNDTDKDGLLDGEEVSFYHSNPLSNDTDGDGMPDWFEAKYHLKINQNDANEDIDSDGLTNLQEYQLGTDPTNPDSNHNGIPDGAEHNSGGNPLDPGNADNFLNHMLQGINRNPGFFVGALIFFGIAGAIGVQQYMTRPRGGS